MLLLVCLEQCNQKSQMGKLLSWDNVNLFLVWQLTTRVGIQDENRGLGEWDKWSYRLHRVINRHECLKPLLLQHICEFHVDRLHGASISHYPVLVWIWSIVITGCARDTKWAIVSKTNTICLHSILLILQKRNCVFLKIWKCNTNTECGTEHENQRISIFRFWTSF